MTVGMLWFDNSNKPVTKKIKAGVEYYEKKYGQPPNMVFVHPSMLENMVKEGDGNKDVDMTKITVQSYQPILPGHIWIGMKE